MSTRFKNIITIALAYVGVIVGAGFSSGKELEQYYVAFGSQGIWALILSVVTLSATGLMILDLGNYYRSQNHNELFSEIASPFFAKIIDLFMNIGLFGLGFLMIAGGGSNLEQMFGVAPWIGSLVIAVAIFLVGFFDTQRITQIIGYLTPLLMIFFLIAPISAIFNPDMKLSLAFEAAELLPTTLPNWTVSSLNHVSMNFMLVISMATIMGAVEKDRTNARYGGLIGGFFVGVLQILGYLSILLKVEVAGGTAMPMLAIVNDLHPILGVLMSAVIYIMIFSTGVGCFYPLSLRLSKNGSEKKFMTILGIISVAGYLLSFIGFETIIAILLPVLGYMGFLVMGLVFYGWFQIRNKKNDRKYIE